MLTVRFSAPSVSMWHHGESSRWAATSSSSIRPTSMAHLPPCWLLRFDCGAIAVPREAWCHWSGRWYVPRNEEKARCVDFISSLQNFRRLSFQFEALCNRIVPGRAAIPGSCSHSRKNRRIFAHFRSDLAIYMGEGVEKGWCRKPTKRFPP